MDILLSPGIIYVASWDTVSSQNSALEPLYKEKKQHHLLVVEAHETSKLEIVTSQYSLQIACLAGWLSWLMNNL